MKKVGIMKTPPGKHKNKRNNKEGIPQLLLWPKPKGYLFGGKPPPYVPTSCKTKENQHFT